MAQLKRGTKVAIFQKPITHEQYEGMAILQRCLSAEEGDLTERWEVVFVDEPGTTYVRNIAVGEQL
jgi:hypothetical protein